ncbi:alpha-amylase family protein [Methylobacterium oxalidis]|uniref:Alpha-amylase n=1 Tax=Methylobacterium oxalidis TaxID=944322 RepID=A0A512JDN3_9HYPH|nr:alpha-amylase family protein [Methylobacterium oxalidis]GEP08056.1 alpha-amylase [Methylobacterium oxalidis]GJE35907.1 Neopullulanase [Methylobacterium oxalidis]GLS64609.1 alpha-amylase [Methylobacterium oxalidis]
MPAWIEHAVWWQVFPLGFVGAEPEAAPGAPIAHRLSHLHAWLDYAVELGISGLALGPIFAASTHGYDTTDHFRIDPRLGDDADFDSLVEAARARGLRILLDGVFNHVGRAHPAFQEVLQRGPQADRASWFRLSWPRGTAPGTEPDYACFEGHRQLVTLNHDEPEVADHVSSVMNHWLARGADGWRLDAAYAVPRPFWANVLPRVRAAHPDAFIVGEVIHGDYASIVRDTGMDAVTQYELWKAIWSALNDRNLFELAHALERHNSYLAAFVPLTFVGNHDVTRIASRLRDERHLPHALAILFTCGGTPSIYAGDEQAFRGLKEERVGGDDAIRPSFPPTPGSLAPYGWSTYRLHQSLIALRRRHPWLLRTRPRKIHLTNEQLVLAMADGHQRVLLALNLADEPAVLPAPGAHLIEIGEGDLGAGGEGAEQVSLRPHGWAILSG